MSYQGSSGGPPLERAIDDYLRAPDTRKTRRHLAYDEADLRVIAERLPGMDAGWADVATVDDITDARLRAAFAKYMVDASERDALRVARTWRGFLKYLTNRRLVNPTAFNGVPPPPPRRSTLKSVVIAPSKGLIATIVLPIILVLAQQYISSTKEQADNEAAVRDDRIRATQIEGIQGTAKAFDDLSALANHIVNTDLKSADLNREMAVAREEAGRQQNATVALLINLQTQFTDLDPAAATNITTLLNELLVDIDATAYYLALPETTDGERSELTSALTLINAGIIGYGNGPAVALLNCLLDFADGSAKEVCNAPRSSAAKVIAAYGDLMQSTVTDIELQKGQFPPLFAISSPAAERFDQLDRELSLWLAQDPSKPVTEFPQYAEMSRLLKSIDRPSRLQAYDVPEPKEYLLALAEYFDVKFRFEYHSPAPDCNPLFEDLKVCFQRPSGPPTTGG